MKKCPVISCDKHYHDLPYGCSLYNKKDLKDKKCISYHDAFSVAQDSSSSSNPFSFQVGGSHYKSYSIQPYEFFYHNAIPHHKAAIIRRILRYDHPTGKGIEDLDKISHEIELIKFLYSKEKV